MIQLRDKLVRIRDGLEVEIRTDDCPKAGSLQQLDGDVTVDLGRGRELDHRGRCVSVRVLDVWQHKQGGFMVRCKVRHIGDLPNLLHCRPWRPLTHDPAEGARDEPENVDESIRARYGMKAGQENVARLADHEKQVRSAPLHEQVYDALDEARRSGVDTTRYEQSIEKRVEALRRRTRRDAA